MITTVLAFTALTALLEALLIYGAVPAHWLERRWVRAALHVAAFGGNLLIHWGTVTGTMTAVAAALASFATLKTLRLANYWLASTRPA
jgi:hypothetical protein